MGVSGKCMTQCELERKKTISDMQAENSGLRCKIKEQCYLIRSQGDQINELEQHIDRLKAELLEYRGDSKGLPSEPIKVADMLISATIVLENKSFKSILGDTSIVSKYSKSDLCQIAKHLFVYCNNSEDEHG